MKKFVLTIALATLALAANAQMFVVGSSISYTSNRSTSVETNLTPNGSETVESMNPSTYNLSIMPKIGYQIDDFMSFGLSFGYSTSNTTSALTYPADKDTAMLTALLARKLADFYGTKDVSTRTISISPYFRYNIHEFNDLTLFIEASVPIVFHLAEKTHLYEEGKCFDEMHTYTEDTQDNIWTSYGVSITPGLNYSFNDHLSMDIYVNAINLGFTMTKTEVSKDSFENNETVTTATEIGVNIHTLPTAAVSLGFNITF